MLCGVVAACALTWFLSNRLMLGYPLLSVAATAIVGVVGLALLLL